MAEPKGPNAEIVAHNQKRAVEVKVFRLREALEAQDVPEAQVDEKCDALPLLAAPSSTRRSRTRWARAPAAVARAEADVGGGRRRPRRPGETHADAQMKAQEMSALKDAFGIGDGHVRGQAFDRSQERKKAERQAEREAHEAQLAEAEAILRASRRRRRGCSRRRRARGEGRAQEGEEGEAEEGQRLT